MKQQVSRAFSALAFLFLALAFAPSVAQQSAPTPLLRSDQPVSWWFAFKLNSTFPGCSGNEQRVCLFGGDVQSYPQWGQQFVYASSEVHALQKGSGCAGDSVNDPVGATFNEIYDGALFYAVWNDQFYDDPKIGGCGQSCSSPWGHSKGVIAWDAEGNGFVMQVTTPSWPAAGSKGHPRQHDGNTLGCVTDDNVLVSQHFFALRLNKQDVLNVLEALGNASVVTNPDDPQVVNNGGPEDIKALVSGLGKKTNSTKYLKFALSSGVTLVSKPSKLQVPPWQMLSSVLDGTSLRAATWWANPKIYSTTTDTEIACWNATLKHKPGAVEIATSGEWEGKKFGLAGGSGPDFNHAKIGVSTSQGTHLVVFGDMNQQGDALIRDPKQCASSQNGRGGLFYVLDDQALHDSVSKLIAGTSAPTAPPADSQ